MTRTEIARAFAEAHDSGDYQAAAAFMTEDMDFVFPHGTISGRDAWLAMRAQQSPPEHLSDRVEDAEFAETEDGAVMTGRLVQRWIESGEVASEQALRVGFTISDGLISRIEFTPSQA